MPDQQIQEYYEAHKTDYVKPELLRIADVFFAAPKANAAERKKKKAKAEEVAAKAKALNPTDSPGFAALVREYSEDTRTKSIDGDSRFVSKEELSSQFAPEVAAAAVEMKKAGEISPLIEADNGFYIVRFQGRQAALNLGIEQVKSQIQNRIQHERRTQNFAKFVDELKAKGNYKLDEGALAKVEVDMKAPSTERKGPEPGFLPSPSGGQTPRSGGRPTPPVPLGARSSPPNAAPPMAKEPPRNP
jgi:parvulin-like peptidyl-prolyl isomerase